MIRRRYINVPRFRAASMGRFRVRVVVLLVLPTRSSANVASTFCSENFVKTTSVANIEHLV